MKVFAIVSEYNPFHKGHKYQIECIKKEFPDAYIVSVTSGSFVQRGESSFIFKHSKAEEAILNGKDAKVKVGVQTGTTGQFYCEGDADWGFAGFAMETVGYKNGSLAVQDLLNGNIQYVIIDSAPAACITEAINELQ